MKSAVLDITAGLRRRAAVLVVGVPTVERRYVAAVVLALPVLALGPYVIPFMLSLAFFCAVTAIFISTAVRAGYSLWCLTVLLMAIVPFVGLTGSVESLPNWMQIMAHIFPVTYIFEGVRTLAVFGAFDGAAFVASVLLSGAYFFFVHLWVSARAESALQNAQYGRLQMID